MFISIWPLIASAAANVVLGYLWYHPKLFGRVWIRDTNVSPDMIEQGKRYAHFYGIAAFIACMILAYVMGTLSVLYGVSSLRDACMFGVLTWLGFVMPTTLGQFLWDQRPLRLYLVNVGYWLVSFVMISCIVFY